MTGQPRRTTIRSTSRRWLSPAIFALAVLAFLLPFATVSCDGAETSFTGVQLVTHTVPRGGTVREPPDCSGDLSSCVESRGSWSATAALVAALLGLALGLLGVQRGPGWCAVAGLLCMLQLGSWVFTIFGPEVEYHSGYWLILLLFVWAGALHARRAWRRSRSRRDDRDAEEPDVEGLPID